MTQAAAKELLEAAVAQESVVQMVDGDREKLTPQLREDGDVVYLEEFKLEYALWEIAGDPHWKTLAEMQAIKVEKRAAKARVKLAFAGKKLS